MCENVVWMNGWKNGILFNTHSDDEKRDMMKCTINIIILVNWIMDENKTRTRRKKTTFFFSSKKINGEQTDQHPTNEPPPLWFNLYEFYLNSISLYSILCVCIVVWEAFKLNKSFWHKTNVKLINHILFSALFFVFMFPIRFILLWILKFWALKFYFWFLCEFEWIIIFSLYTPMIVCLF